MLWCRPATIYLLLEEWLSLRVNSDVTLWELLPYAIYRSVWQARNNLIFQNQGFSFDTVWDLHITRLAWWIKSWWRQCPFGVYDFFQNFLTIRVKKVTAAFRSNVWLPPANDDFKFNTDGQLEERQVSVE